MKRRPRTIHQRLDEMHRQFGDLADRFDHVDRQLTRIIGKENTLMGQSEDLAAAVELVKDSNTAQETRIEAIITLLESRPDDPLVAQAIADLTALKNQQDAHRPDPVTTA